MANSIYKVHEMINKVGFEFDDATAKKVTQLAEKAGQLAADNMKQELSAVVSEIGNIFNQALAKIGKEQIDLTDMIKMPDNNTINRLTSNFVSQIAGNISDGIISGINDGVHKSKSLLKDLSALENAYTRHKNKSGSKTGKKVKAGLVNSVKGAFDYEPSDTAIKIGNNLRAITNEYNKAMDWEDQYVALLKYIKAYEALEKITSDPSSLDKWKLIGEHAIQDLKEARPEIEHSLQNIFNVAYGKAITGLTDAGDIDISVKLTPIKMIDVYDVVGKSGQIEVEVIPVIKKAKKNVVANMYRGVHRPNLDPSEGTIEGRSINREVLGGNYWVAPESQGFVARAYGEESGLDDAKTMKAYANALNKIQVSAIKDGMSLLFSDIDQIDFLRYLFPGVENFKNVADPEGYDLTQKFYNEMARQSGFDLLEIFDVNEGGDEIANTMVTLQNRIIEYIGNIPKYLDIEKFTPEMEQRIISQQKGSSERWYEQTIGRLEQELNDAIVSEDVNKQQKLQTIIPQLKQMQLSAMQAFDDAIVAYGGYIAEEVQRGLPQVITENEDGQLVGRISEESLKDRLLKYADLMSVSEDSDEYDRAQAEMEDLYSQILSAIPERLQGDADNLLSDFAYGDKSIDEAMQYFAPHLAYKDNLLPPQGVSATEKTVDVNRKAADESERKAQADKEAAEATAKAAEEAEKERIAKEAAAQARREELSNKLNEYQGDVLTSQEADANLQERERILQQLRNEDLLTEEIENNYNEINKRLETRANLLRQAEGYYDDVDDVLTGARVDSVDDEAQYRRDHIKPFDDTITQMQNSGTFSEDEIDRFLAISDAMEERIGMVVAETSLNKLDDLYDETYDITNADKLNDILEERKQILSVLESNAHIDYSDEIEHQKQINAELEKRVTLLREAQNGTINVDDIDDILQENGTLEAKLERLYNVSQDWGIKIKDGEEDEAIDELEAFEETYDRIILKLANGRNIEILPNAKGLRALYKYSDGIDPSAYGETEIDDIVFERVKTEASAADQAVDDLNESIEKTHQLNQGTSDGGAGIGDASSAELKAVQEEAEKLRQENVLLQSERDSAVAGEDMAYARAYESEAEAERLRQELTNKSIQTDLLDSPSTDTTTEETRMKELKETVEAVTTAVGLKTEAFKDEAIVVNTVVESEIAQLSELEQKVLTIKSTLEGLFTNIKTGQDDIGAGLNNIVVNVNYPETQQNDLAPVIDAIGRISLQPTAVTDVGNVLATENTLSAIKTAVESIDSKAQKGIRADMASNEPLQNTDKAMVLYEAEPDSQISGGGNHKPVEKIKTALTALLKYKTTLQEANQLSGDLEIGINNLYAELSKVSDKDELMIWNEHFKQFKNASSMIQTLIKDYKTLGDLQAKAEAETDPTKLAHYIDNIEILQDRIAVKSVDVNVGDDRFEEARQRAYNIARHELQQKEELIDANQVEAEIIKRLTALYEQLGKARATGNMMEVTRIRRLIGADRSQLASVNYATDMKFKAARDKGYNAEKTKAENKALKEQETIVKNIVDLYQKYGDLQARSENADEGMTTWYSNEAKKIEAEIRSETNKLKLVTDAMQTSFDAAYAKGKDIAESDILKKLYAEEDKTKSNDIDKLGKSYEELGKLQAKFAQNSSFETEREIEKLKESLNIKVQELGLTRDQIAALETKRNLAEAEAKSDLEAIERDKTRAYYAKEEEKARKKAQSEQQKADKEAWNKEKKSLRVQNGLNVADSTMRSGNKAIIDAIGNEQISADVDTKVDELREQIERLAVLKKEAEKAINLNQEVDSKEIAQQTARVKELTEEMNRLLAIHQKYSGDNAEEIVGDAGSFSNLGLQEYEQQLMAAAQASVNGTLRSAQFNAETKELTATVKEGGNTFRTYSFAVDEVEGKLKKLNTGTKKTETFLQSIARKTRELAVHFAGMISVYDVVRYVKQGVQYVKEVDSALTELKKVTNETEEAYERFLNTASETANKVGSTIKDLVNSTADWARIGYNMEEAAALAESTAVLLNVSEFQSIDDATSALTSTLQAFGYTANQSMHVVDILNEVGNNFAISSDGIATALQDSASSLMAANNSYEEAVALIASANRVVQDPNSVGAALRTISLRLRGTSVEELSELGEDTSGAIESISKLQSKIQALSGVNILTDTGAYKSTYEILLEISRVFEDMSDMDQAALLEILAGKTRSNTAAAILSNTEDLEAAFKSATEAEGSALRENEKYLDSIQGRIDLFNNALQTMWNNALDIDIVKGIVNLGTELIKIVDTLGLIPSALIVIGALKGFPLLFKVLKDGGLTVKALTASFWSYLTGIKAVNAVNVKQILTEKILRANWIKSLATQKLKEIQEKKLAAAKAHLDFINNRYIIGVATAEQVEKAEMLVKQASIPVDITKISTTELLSLAFKKLAANIWATMKAIAPLAVAAIAIVGVTHVVDALLQTTKELKEEYDELNNTLSETESKLSSLESELSAVNDKIKEINEQGSLSFTDQEELNNLKAQSAELERQIALNETLQKQQQVQMNESALAMANNYANVGKTTGKTTSELTEGGGKGGAVVGGVIGGIALGGKIGAAVGTLIPIPVVGNIIGYAAGALVGAAVGAAIGAAGGAGIGAMEEKVGDSLDNIKEQHEKLQEDFNKTRNKYQKDPSKQNKKKFEEAQEALRDYEATTAEYLSTMDSYYSQMDWETATAEQRQAMQEFYDTQDKWAIQSGATNAKSNAITRIFGDTASDDIKALKADIEDAMEAAKATGTEPNFDFQKVFNSDKLVEFKQRLYDLGITVTDVEYYFRDLAKAEKEAEDSYTTYDTVKQINALSDSVNKLKDAFGEIQEEGYVSTETLVALSETFGDLGDSWETFVNTVATGTSSIKEATEAINDLVEAYLMEQLAEGPMSAEEQLKTIMLLHQLGVRNAKEYVDAMQKASAVNSITETMTYTNEDEYNEYNKLARKKGNETYKWTDANEERYQKLKEKLYPDMEKVIAEYEAEYNVDLSGEKERLLIEQSITAEKAQQAVIEASQKQTEREEAERKKKLAEEDKINAEAKLAAAEAELERVKAEVSYDSLTHLYGNTYEDAAGQILLIDTTDIEAAQKAVDAAKEVVEEAAKKSDAIDIPAEVDAEGLEQQAKDEAQKLQDMLDEYGLEVNVDLNEWDGISSKIDAIQGAYSTLTDVVDEYNEKGFINLDNLQAFLSLEPEYLACLQMENGQLSINQAALEQMIQLKLAEAKATVVQSTMEQLHTLATNAQTKATNDSATAASNAIGGLGAYASTLSIVAQEAIGAAGAVAAFNAAVAGAQEAGVSQEDIDTILNNMNTQLGMIDSISVNLPTNFDTIVAPDSSSSSDDEDDAFQKEMDYWENQIAAQQAKYEQIQNEIDLLEKQGMRAGAEYYQEQIKLEEQRRDLLEQQKAAAQEFLGQFDEGSDEWWEAANVLNDIESELDDVTASIQELNDAIAQIHWDNLEEFGERVSNLHTELEDIRDVLSSEDMFNEQGEWTEAGVATLGTYIQEIEMYKNELKEIEDELNDFGRGYQGNEDYFKTTWGIDSEQEYYDKLTELNELQREYTKGIHESEQSVVEMYEDQIDAIEDYTSELVDSYNDYIDVVKEALDAEKDLYEFKKNVKKQTKDIATLERRIAALTGSNSAADIAERRKLEAELYEAKEDLNDTYYDHAKDQQDQALDDESEAYAESMENYIEKLRDTLKEAQQNMDSFMNKITTTVMVNAGVIEQKYNETGLAISEDLISPWHKAYEAMQGYEIDGLALMNSWTAVGGFFDTFDIKATNYLESPWEAGKTAVNSFQKAVSNALQNIAEDVENNVATASGQLSQLYADIVTTQKKINEVKADNSGSNPDPESKPEPKPETKSKNYITVDTTVINVMGEYYGKDGVRYYKIGTDKWVPEGSVYKQGNKYYAVEGSYWYTAAEKGIKLKQSSSTNKTNPSLQQTYDDPYSTLQYQKYASGTTSTTKDQWAITDEPWLGDELVLVPTAQGNLSYMRKGTAVMPADISENLMEWGKLNPNMMNVNGIGANLNMISNAINKPNYEFSFDSLVHVDNCSQETLKDLEKMVDNKINNFSKQLNYSIKKFAR